jgi:hypothetical protein
VSSSSDAAALSGAGGVGGAGVADAIDAEGDAVDDAYAPPPPFGGGGGGADDRPAADGLLLGEAPSWRGLASTPLASVEASRLLRDWQVPCGVVCALHVGGFVRVVMCYRTRARVCVCVCTCACVCVRAFCVRRLGASGARVPHLLVDCRAGDKGTGDWGRGGPEEWHWARRAVQVSERAGAGAARSIAHSHTRCGRRELNVVHSYTLEGSCNLLPHAGCVRGRPTLQSHLAEGFATGEGAPPPSRGAHMLGEYDIGAEVRHLPVCPCRCLCAAVGVCVCVCVCVCV